MNANQDISNQVEQNFFSNIVALLNQELGKINLPNRPEAPNVSEPEPVILQRLLCLTALV